MIGSIMLAELVKSQGISVIDESALPIIWAFSSWEARKLFSHLLLERNSILYYYLALKGLDLPNLGSAGTSDVIEERFIADAIFRIARSRGHNEVNEVHVLAALIELVPWGLREQFAILENARRPARSEKRVDEILGKLYRSGQNWMAEKLIRSRERSHLSRAEIIERLEEYLSSKYYPFGIEEWSRFEMQQEPNAEKYPNSLRTCALKAFAAHRTREEVGKQCEQ
jgi:hypothetical protein